MAALAVVTGGGSGIGRALALRLSQRGLAVLIVGRRPEALAETAALASAAGGAAVTLLAADVAAADAPARIAAAVAASGLPLRALVHNAGVLGPIQPLAEVAPADLARVLAVNVAAPLALTRALLPALGAGARILHVSSGAAQSAIEGWGAYCVSKAALHMAWRVLREELAPRGVGVGSARPGVVDTDMQAAIRGGDGAVFPSLARFAALKAAADAAPRAAPGGAPPPAGALDTPANCAVFLAWLLLDAPAADFSASEWDSRDAAHHAHWAAGAGAAGAQPPAPQQ